MNAKSDLIENAIEFKKIITFDYDGYDRKAQPHHYGVLKGKDQLQAYQIGGSSKGGKPIGWKNFEIAKIENLSLDDTRFQPRSDHNPLNSKYTKIKKSVS